jgi:hypothetical protein
MKKQILVSVMAMLAGSMLAADLKDEVTAAAKKLADSGYSWKTTVARGGDNANANARTGPGPAEGKMSKDGVIELSMKRGENTMEAYLSGGKGAVKTQDGWKSLEEVRTAARDQAGGQGAGGQRGRGGMLGRGLQNYKAPSTQATDIIGNTQGLKKDGDAIVGELTEAGVKALLMPGRRPGGNNNAPEPSNAKGSVKFWIKDGALSKMEYNVKATMTFNNNERQVDRTTTIEFKDIGSTKVEVPEEAKKKMS